MSIYMVAFRGGMPLGSLAGGYAASLTSAPHVLDGQRRTGLRRGALLPRPQRRQAALVTSNVQRPTIPTCDKRPTSNVQRAT